MDFQDFLSHNEAPVRDAASILLEAKVGLDAGELSKDEFEEIAEDVLQIGEMQKLADTLERKIAIQAAVDIMMVLVKAVPKP